ncbi:hypothetical protein AMJ48_00740 [Parcubacteria bacterium DG_74_1]|nr:MAG: hypothetical protein AMJ48_00740 [Parcubacteria bacterium DG_74_1]
MAQIWIPLIVVIALAILAKAFIRRVLFPEYWVVDRNGELIEKKPGYRILIPIIDKVYARVKTNIDYSIPLFGEEKEHSVDLAIGGRIRLSSPQIWIMVKEPKTTVKEASDFEKQISDIAEHRLAGAINVLTPDEVMVMRAPKGSKAEKTAAKELLVKKIDEIIGESPQLIEFLQRIKVDYRGITIADFDFEDTLARKREEIVTTGMDKDIGKNRGEAKTNELLAIGEIAEILEKKGFPPSEAQEISSERYQDHLVAEKGKLQKVVWQGGGGDIAGLAAQWQKGNTILGEGPAEKKGGETGEEELLPENRTTPTEEPTGSRPSEKKLKEMTLGHAREQDEAKGKKK